MLHSVAHAADALVNRCVIGRVTTCLLETHSHLTRSHCRPEDASAEEEQTKVQDQDQTNIQI